ncbi:YggT family protein [Rodentibacter caecimuris]|uniref:YggT family protein n=1 Tax=Rodentibacter caecimuris TaxID=1796644 RepID=A0ABX3KVZ8_9PAST|nr:hypothetical protein BKG89_09160 [Rodentibacter heylii]
MNSIQYLLDTLISVYGFILFFRAWFQFSGVDFYHSSSQFLVKATQPILTPLRKVFPTIKKLDSAVFIAILVLMVIKYPLINLFGSSILSGGPLGYLLLGILSTVNIIGKGIMYILLIGAIASWFNRGNTNPIQYVLYQLGEPILNPVRRFLPNTGMIDFSPMLVLFVMFFINRVLFDIFGNLWVLA